MRVAFCGNVANNFYQIAKALRRFEDIDAHLYLEPHELQNSPESDDPDIVVDYPSWVHRLPTATLREKLFPRRSAFVRDLEGYDLVVASGAAAALANDTTTPVAFYATGHDLTVTPFALEYAWSQPRATAALKALRFSVLQRRGIERCRDLWVAPYEPFLHALRRLGISETRVARTYFPLIIDPARFGRPPELPHELPGVSEIRERFDFTVFHPSRLMIRASEKVRLAGQWKANDILIRAFAKFVEKAGTKRIGLVLLDRQHPSWAPSWDVREARRLVRSLGIEENVLWLKGPHDFGFTRAELVSLYFTCDVVADDFGAGWFGSVVLEGLTAGRPVLSYVDERAMKRMYPWHPILSSNEVTGNAELLLRLYRDVAFRRDVGERGRRWVDEFHAPEPAARVYACRIRELVGGAR